MTMRGTPWKAESLVLIILPLSRMSHPVLFRLTLGVGEIYEGE